MTQQRHIFDLRGGGMGDAVCAAWIASGARSHGISVEFSSNKAPAAENILAHWPDRSEVLNLLDQRMTDDAGEPFQGPARLFDWELRYRGVRQPRPFMWQKRLGLAVQPERPTVTIPESDHLWARAKQRELARPDQPLVLLFPTASFAIRSWPFQKWARLAHALRDNGVAVACIDFSFGVVDRLPNPIACEPLGHIAALMRLASLVVVNDSGPAHLSGTLGTQTLALMGPTDPVTAFGYCPDVECMTAKEEDVRCVGCHFEPERGFSWACDQGCEALAMIGWERVYERAMELVKEPAVV